MTRNGAATVIVEFVRKHPGCTRRQILDALGSVDERNAMPAYCRKAGMIFAAGPRGSQRYYPTAEQAQAADQRIRDDVRRTREHKRRQGHIRQNVLRRAKRMASSGRGFNTQPGRQIVTLEPGVVLHPQCKVTIAPPMLDRWAR